MHKFEIIIASLTLTQKLKNGETLENLNKYTSTKTAHATSKLYKYSKLSNIFSITVDLRIPFHRL